MNLPRAILATVLHVGIAASMLGMILLQRWVAETHDKERKRKR